MTTQQHLDEAVRVDPYAVVGEMLEYFERYSLATWAPLAEIIERERGNAHAAALDLLATKDAEIAERDRENTTLRSVLEEIAELADEKRTAKADRLALILALAAPYRKQVDPLVEAIREMALSDANADDAKALRAALASRGLEIVAQRGEGK